MKQKIFLLILSAFLMLGTLTAQAQGTYTAKGKVLDSAGAPVAGATVVVTGTNSYAVTSEDGTWEIANVASDALLTINCIGFEEMTVKAGGRAFIDIVLSDAITFLEEAVAIGYGTMKKSDLTGSVASVNPGKLTTTPSNSIEGIMQGRVAGLQIIQSDQNPGASSTVRIRGNSSINGSNAPLLVVDGFPFGDAGNLKQINPADIISMEVLKDASASAIYGSRGANGVILITTTKAGREQTRISVRQQTTVSQFTSRLNLWRDPVLMAMLNNEARVNSGLTPSYVGQVDANGVYYPSIDELQTTWTTNTHWDELTLRKNPVSNNTTVQITSSNDKTSFSMSANYYKENGVYIKDDFTKFGGRFAIDHKVYRNFTLKASANIVHSKRNNNNGLAYWRNPIFPVYDEDGNYWRYSASDYYHPIALTELRKNVSTGLDVIANAGFNWQIVPCLNLTGQLNYKHGESISDQYYPKVYSETGAFNNGYGTISNWKDDNVVADIYATFDKTFASKHHLTAMAGYSFESYLSRSSYLTGVGFANEALGNENLAAGDPEKYRIGNGLAASQLVSGMARLNYVYDNRFLVTATARADGSSKFGSGNKWAAFPSGAVSWNVHNEPWMKDQNVVDALKLRASYGISGNQGISAYQTLSRYGMHKYYADGAWQTAIGPGYQSGTTGQDGIYALWSGIANSNLKWETTSQLDFGVDMSFFKDRLNITFDWYNKITDDLLRERNIAPSSGYDRMWVNDGKIQNRGVELTLNGTLVSTRDWHVGATLVMSRNENKVLSLGNALESGLMTDARTGMQYEYTGNQYEQFRSYTNILAIGQPMYVFYGYKTDGIVQSLDEGLSAGLTGGDAEPGEFKYVDIFNPDGIETIDENDRCIIGDPNPDLLASFCLDMKWKNLDFSVFFNGVFGNDVVNTKAFDQPNNMPLRWTPDNPTNDYPRLNSNRQTKFSDWWIEDGSFVRVQNLMLGYTFNLQNVRWMDSIRLYFNVDNLYTFTKFKGYDPEVGMNGIYSGGLPRLRKFTFGLEFNF